MITRDDYFMGRDNQYPDEWTEDIEENAAITVKLANQLCVAFGEDRGVNSGWRPPEVNAVTPHASSTSKHMTGQAIDITDHDGALDAWCMDHEGVLVNLGLWMESPRDTPGWCHVQTVAPPSGNRVFLAK